MKMVARGEKNISLFGNYGINPDSGKGMILVLRLYIFK